MAYADAAVARAKDRERHRRRTPGTGRRRGCARAVESASPRRSGRSAPHAPRNPTEHPAPATRGCATPACPGGTRPGRGPVSANGPAARPRSAARRVCVFDAGPPRRRPAGSPASRAWRNAAPRTARITPPRRPPGSSTEGRTRSCSAAPAAPGANGARNSGSRRGSAFAAASALPAEGGTTCAPCPREAPGGGAPAVCRPQGRRPLYPLLRPGP